MCSSVACCVQNSGVRPERWTGPSLETWLSDTLDGVAGVVAIGLVGAGLIGSQGTPRILLALGFLLFVPGRAIAANWDLPALRSQATVSMLFSLVILALLAAVTLWAHYWHPIGLMQAEAGLSLAGLAIAVARRHRYRRRDTPVAGDSAPPAARDSAPPAARDSGAPVARDSGASLSLGADSSGATEELRAIMRGESAGTAAPHGAADLGEITAPINPPTTQQ
jgi:hypothetical protein